MFSRFTAAFTSRSWTTPQDEHVHSRIDSGSSSSFLPHAEHVLLLAKKRSATTTRPPRIAALYSNCRRNSKKPMSAMERDRWRFRTMPRTFRFSTPMVWKRRVRSVVSLCNASERTAAMRACNFASLALALRRLADPLTLRD